MDGERLEGRTSNGSGSLLILYTMEAERTEQGRTEGISWSRAWYVSDALYPVYYCQSTSSAIDSCILYAVQITTPS